MLQRLVLMLLGVVVLVSAPAAMAEVRAITDRSGEYKGTRILTRHVPGNSYRLKVAPRRHGVWRPIGRGAGMFTLNAAGDRQGDLFPTIAEPQGSGHPWVFWSSRHGAADYDINFSRWQPDGWSGIQSLAEGMPGHDLDPRAAFDAAERPYVVWWNQKDGHGQVMFSMFLRTHWMAPMLVSDKSIDSRNPDIALDDGTITIGFRTPTGASKLVIHLYVPFTITDDINPLGLWDKDNSSGDIDEHDVTVPLWDF